MLRIVYEVKPAIEALEAMAERVSDLRPAWRAIVLYLKAATIQQFASQGARLGSPWQPLSPAYATAKAIRYPGKPILRATDAMFNSLASVTADSIVELEPQAMSYGTRDRKAQWHQKGTRRMPARKILGLMAQDKQMVKSLVKDHLANQLKFAGFEVV